MTTFSSRKSFEGGQQKHQSRRSSTIYRLAFLPSARREWDKLGSTVREQFKRKIAERLERPRVEADRLRTLPDCYKIKLRSAGYRLVYRVEHNVMQIVVVAVGRRDNDLIYKAAAKRS